MPQFLIILGFAAMGAIFSTSLITSTRDQLTSVSRVQNRQEGFYNGELAAWVAFSDPAKPSTPKGLDRSVATFAAPVILNTDQRPEYAKGTPLQLKTTSALDSNRQVLNRLPELSYVVLDGKSSKPTYVGESSVFSKYQSKVILASYRPSSNRSLVFQPKDMSKKPPVKVVFVVDDSRSMAEEQSRLASATAPMLDALHDIGLNAQIFLYSTSSATPMNSYQNSSLITEKKYFNSKYQETSSPSGFPYYEYEQAYMGGPLFVRDSSTTCEIRIDSAFIAMSATSTLTYSVKGTNDALLATNLVITNAAGAPVLSQNISGGRATINLYTAAEGSFTVNATIPSKNVSCTAKYRVGTPLACNIAKISTVDMNDSVNIAITSPEDTKGRIANLTVTSPTGSILYNGPASSTNTKTFKGNTVAGSYQVTASFNGSNFCTREYRVRERDGSSTNSSAPTACTVKIDSDRVIQNSSTATATLKVTGSKTGIYETSVRIKEDSTQRNREDSYSISTSSSGGVVTLLTGNRSRYLVTGNVRNSNGGTIASCSTEYTVVDSALPPACYITATRSRSLNTTVTYRVMEATPTLPEEVSVQITGPENGLEDSRDRQVAWVGHSESFTPRREGIYTIMAYADKNYPCFADVQVGTGSFVPITDLVRVPLELDKSMGTDKYQQLRDTLSASITNLGTSGADEERGLDPIAWLLTEDRKPGMQINPGDLAIFFVISDANSAEVGSRARRMELTKFSGTKTVTVAPTTYVTYSLGVNATNLTSARVSYSYSKQCTDSETGASYSCNGSGSYSDPENYGYPSCSGTTASSNVCTPQLLSRLGVSSASCSYSCSSLASTTAATNFTDYATNAQTRDLCTDTAYIDTIAKNYCSSGFYIGANRYRCGSATASSCNKGSYSSSGYSRSDLVEAIPASKDFAAITKAVNGVESNIIHNKMSVPALLANLPTDPSSVSEKHLKTYADMKLGPQNYWFTFIVHDTATEKSLGMSCSTGEEQATNYINLAKMLPPGHASIYPICASDYRPAVLDKTITPVINFVTRVFSAPTVGSESVLRVVIQRSDGTERVLQPTDYKVASGSESATVTLDPSIPISETDRVVIVFGNAEST